MMPIKHYLSYQLRQNNKLVVSTFLNRQLSPSVNIIQSKRGKRKAGNDNASTLFRPVPVESNPDDINIGVELTGSLSKNELLKIIDSFTKKPQVRKLSLEFGLQNHILDEAFSNFRKYCIQTKSLPADLHVTLSDILQGAGNVTDIFPYFMRHAKKTYPHLECLDDLKKISDLRTPANWYPLARTKTRKIIFHAGPTNSGKTYHALKRLMSAKTGVYCGPLKLLAVEVFQKCNSMGTPCDLVTGEERNYIKGEENPSNHVSCSVEMVNLSNTYEVAVIDEIQLVRDTSRGWAWTRALLGVVADEVHLCGEVAAINLVESICQTTGEVVEVRKYKRLTELEIEKQPLYSLHNVQPGDCIVCFNKNDIFSVSRSIESQGVEVAVIYGSLPPGTKLAQAAKFNDPNSTCKVLVATNAIGMGLNLHIRRIVFYSLLQPTVNEKGEKEMNTISVSSALQIAGRAGRHGTQWEKGYVTTFKPEDLQTLKKLLSQTPSTILKAGLHPTADQIELYAYHLPDASLSNLMDIFVSLCTVDDSLYFICNIDDFKFLADMIQQVPLPLRARYIFCCAPINRNFPFLCTMFQKFARQYSKNDVISFKWLSQYIGWPFTMPKTLVGLLHLEAVFDILDLYLWLSYRFPDLFPDRNAVRDVQKELDNIIQEGVFNLVKILKNTEMGLHSAAATISRHGFEMKLRRQNFYKDFPPGKRGDVNVGRGKLTEKLLAEGLLTQEMLQELQMEWANTKKKK